jgi:hypothetical protein
MECLGDLEGLSMCRIDNTNIQSAGNLSIHEIMLHWRGNHRASTFGDEKDV